MEFSWLTGPLGCGLVLLEFDENFFFPSEKCRVELLAHECHLLQLSKVSSVEIMNYSFNVKG